MFRGTTRFRPAPPAHATSALAESPRHGEWVDIKLPDGVRAQVVRRLSGAQGQGRRRARDSRHQRHGGHSARAWAISSRRTASSPSCRTSCPARDRTAAAPNRSGPAVGQTIRALTDDEMTARLNAAMEYGKKLPASNGKTAVIGFCWGGTQSFNYAIAQPNLNAAVVYYGNPTAGRPRPTSRPKRTTRRSRRRCIGMYGGNDARIGAHDSADRSRDEEARQVLREAHLRRRRATASWAIRRAQAARTSRPPNRRGR